MKTRRRLKISAILTAAILLLPSAYAATLCSYKGPDTSEHDLQLSDFLISGESSVRVGNIVSVSFKLRNVGKTSITFDEIDGVLVAAKEPDGKSTTFGSSNQGKTLKQTEFLTFKTNITLDKEGAWTLWASYCIKLEEGAKVAKCGPEKWHACKVEAKPKCSEGCECLTEEMAKKLDYIYCKGEKIFCGYNQYQKPMYCYEKPAVPSTPETCHYDFEKEECLGSCPSGQVCHLNTVYRDPANGKVTYGECTCKAPPKDTTSPNLSATLIPESPVLGDRVRYEVSANDSSGIAIIKIFMNGENKKACFASFCDYATRPIGEEPEFGAVAVDMLGNFIIEGAVPEEESRANYTALAQLDIDHDGISDLADNCISVFNPGQGDIDHDGVGDASDACCPACMGLLLPEYCCDAYYINYEGSCTDEISLRSPPNERYYWEDFYGSVSDTGCGCYDSDGNNLFEEGYALDENVINQSCNWELSQCIPPRSTCEQYNDRCINSTHIEELLCGPDGLESQIIKCPSEVCESGRCTCPDTDGGWDYYSQGTVLGNTDYCLDSSRLAEHSCGLDSFGNFIADTRTVRCEYGCENGACVCQDSDGGWDYEVRGRIGIYEDDCIDRQTLVEYYAYPWGGDEEGTCEITSRTHTCDGLCENGKCLPPSCDDGIMNQGEEDVDCGGPCTTCGYAAIRGRILYEDVSSSGSNFKPVRYGKFKISGISTSTQQTDSNGYFYVLIPRDGNVGKEIYIHIGGCDMYNSGFNYAVKIAKDLDYCDQYMWWDSFKLTIPETGDLDFSDLRIGNNADLEFNSGYRNGKRIAGNDPCRERWCGSAGCSCDNRDYNGGSAFFNIADAVLFARQYADGKRDDDDSIGMVRVEWPDTEWPNFNDNAEIIKLDRDHGFNDGTIVHEYGHHLQDQISEHCDTCGGDHSRCDDKYEEFAWSEGFAEYFGTIVPHSYADLSEPNFAEIEIEKQCDCPSSASSIEATVAAILWDLVDDYQDPAFPDSDNEAFDTISGREDLIFGIFDNEIDHKCSGRPDLCRNFVEEGWNCRVSGAERDAIFPILQHYDVHHCEAECD